MFVQAEAEERKNKGEKESLVDFEGGKRAWKGSAKCQGNK